MSVEPTPTPKRDLFARLPDRWPDNDLRLHIAQRNRSTRRCIVALDDDPTGTQTVHGIWVLTSWEVDDLERALAADEPALYVLTNSRSLSLEAAQALNRQVVANLVTAAKRVGRPVTLISRSDSTLRGHFPGEVDAICEALAEQGHEKIDAICLIPFFAEGGRFTMNDVHWVQEDELLLPAAQTPYAQDPVFGYSHSYLPAWVEEKTAGAVRAEQVVTLSLETIRQGGPARVYEQLMQLEDRQILVVNAADDRDLEVFVAGLLDAEEAGKSYVFRTAASFVKVMAGILDRPFLERDELVEDRPSGGGLVVFGSYVPKSSAQLERLLQLDGIRPVELQVKRVIAADSREVAIQAASDQLAEAISRGEDAVLFTSRQLVTGDSQEQNLAIGRLISAGLVEVVNRLDVAPRFLIGKGGITSSDLVTDGLRARSARVLGQVLPGVPAWKTGPESRWPGLPYIVFPGNVGGPESVAQVVQMLRG